MVCGEGDLAVKREFVSAERRRRNGAQVGAGAKTLWRAAGGPDGRGNEIRIRPVARDDEFLHRDAGEGGRDRNCAVDAARPPHVHAVVPFCTKMTVNSIPLERLEIVGTTLDDAVVITERFREAQVVSTQNVVTDIKADGPWMFSMLQGKLGEEGPTRLVVPKLLTESVLAIEGTKLDC